MPKGTRICKICGKEYEYCKTQRASNIFRWQDVACSYEHGQEYLKQIIRSRSDEAVESTQSTVAKTKKKQSRAKAEKVLDSEKVETTVEDTLKADTTEI